MESIKYIVWYWFRLTELILDFSFYLVNLNLYWEAVQGRANSKSPQQLILFVTGNRRKMKLIILTLVLLSTLFSCIQPNGKKNIPLVTNDSFQTNIDKIEKERLERREALEEQDYADSVRLDKVLQDALKIASQSFSSDKFFQKYEVSPDSVPVSVEISLDYHFTNKNPHLIIRRVEPNTIFIDIFAKGENKFKKVVAHKQWSLEYVNDTIQDINGDGHDDLVVNWYGMTGCCLKAFSNVYLLRQNAKAFSESFEFINPTFSPKEKIIRGVCYGHPGETEMYKYKWNGEKIDTIEYVAFETKKQAISSKTGNIQILNSNYKTVKLLKEIPIEYHEIYGFDWFTGNGYQ